MAGGKGQEPYIEGAFEPGAEGKGNWNGREGSGKGARSSQLNNNDGAGKAKTLPHSLGLITVSIPIFCKQHC